MPEESDRATTRIIVMGMCAFLPCRVEFVAQKPEQGFNLWFGWGGASGTHEYSFCSWRHFQLWVLTTRPEF